MSLYSDFAPRRTLQIVADAAAVSLVMLAIFAGIAVHGAIAAFGAIMRRVEDAGVGLRDTLTDIGDALGGVPFIGEGIREHFDAAGDAGDRLADAGRAGQSLIETVAVVAGVGVAAVPIAVLLLVWLWPRLRFARRAAETRALLRLEDGEQLLALRALGGVRASVLARISPRAVTDWREGEARIVRALASLEARTAGVRIRV